MELKDFVAETLNQIVAGVESAQKTVQSSRSGAKINPSSGRLMSQSTQANAMLCQETGVPLQRVQFDVAVTAKEDQTKTEGGSSLGSISVSPHGSSSTQNSSSGRIQFDVPVLLPMSKVESTSENW